MEIRVLEWLLLTSAAVAAASSVKPAIPVAEVVAATAPAATHGPAAAAAAAAAKAAGNIPGCCSPDIWQGRQSAIYLSGIYLAQMEMDVTYDAVKKRTVLTNNVTDSFGSYQKKHFYFYGTGKKYSYNIKQGTCTVQNISTDFPKRCIPATAKVLNSNLTVNTANGTIQASRVYYEKPSHKDLLYGILVTKDVCFPITETLVFKSDSYKMMHCTYTGLTEGIQSEDIFNIPAACKQNASMQAVDWIDDDLKEFPL